ncbi:MAG: NADH-quinone oxidoreductase subunit NuoE [Rhodospirillaceae bacterium]|jgi:NADH-quinone oxidoreductase E subunit|nr:NADH-quinone oxidoreductase subunit NuoE [Rhodospirillaceae bacterium]MBT6136757.1 NADH-quinone oxidoreductase subunit NuoE [Rhodospirillaceae bacterium]
MSAREFAKDQPDSFAFSAENEETIKAIIAKYPDGKQASAVIPLLDLAQRQNDNWIPVKAMEAIAERLDMAKIRVMEVATFYTMFNLAPVGKYFLQACTTTPCWLRGSDQVMKCVHDKLGLHGHYETTDDGMFTLLEVECLGACVNAPILQVNDDFYEDLDYEKTAELLDALKRGEAPPVGSLAGRNKSESSAGATTLAQMRPAAGED